MGPPVLRLVVKGKVTFDRKAKPEPEFTEEQRLAVAKAAGMVADLGQKAQAGGGERAVCSTRRSDDPDCPLDQDRTPAAPVPSRTGGYHGIFRPRAPDSSGAV